MVVWNDAKNTVEDPFHIHKLNKHVKKVRKFARTAGEK